MGFNTQRILFATFVYQGLFEEKNAKYRITTYELLAPDYDFKQCIA